MGQDIEWKSYFSDDERYADIINGIVFRGKQIVAETDLHEVDTQTGYRRGMRFIRKWQNANRRRSRIRDSVRKTAFGVNFVIIGIESQEVIDYSIPLRNMAYDVGEYEKQAARIRREVRKHHEGLESGEYLYGFRKESRLYPVVTFILYSGKEAWDGPKSLHEIIDFTDLPDELKKMVSDYRIHVIDVRRFNDTGAFRTDVRHVFDFIRCSEDKHALYKLVEQDDYYKNMEEDAFDIVSHYANAVELLEVKDYYGKEGKVDMCKAIRDLMEDSRAEGIEEGADRINQLIILLSEQGRMDDIVRAAKDRKYQERLFREELGSR
ncbi:MAG: transposase [Lachnospiraceae bacterium]|nr:transposase [Lachnospiraceae bacterium]